MRRDRRVLVLLLACALLVVSGRALVVDQRGVRQPSARGDRDAAKDALRRRNEIVLVAESATHSVVRVVFGDSLGPATLDLAALLVAAYLVTLALVPTLRRHRAWPAALLRGPPRPLVR